MRAIAITTPILLKHEHPYERRIRYACGILACVLAMGYVYFVSASVLNIIAREEAHMSISHTTSSIAELEEQYFSLVGSMTKQRASELGLVAVSDKHFVTRTTRLGQAAPAASESEL